MTDPSGLAEVIDRRVGPVPVCEIRGELDASNVDRVLERIMAGVPYDAPGVVVDLEHTSYLDSAGVRILFGLARSLGARHQQLRIVAPAQGIVRRVLVLTALADVVPVDEELARAVELVQSRI